MRITAPFSYYGGKSKLAHLYPPPVFDTIVEPFCGGASYSFKYYERNVILNDLDEETSSIWTLLTSKTAAEIVERYVPLSVRAGDRVSELVPDWPGLRALLRAEANQGTQGARGCHDQITVRGAVIWNRNLKKKLLTVVIPRVSHWRVVSADYTDLPNQRATWFVDPPYANAAGNCYRLSYINYNHLASWCKSRKGQTIVCENAGATWLPFTPLTKRRGFVSSYQKSDAMEVVWTQ
jgi:hypothetical protein